MRGRSLNAIFLAIALSAAPILHADEVTDQVQVGVDAYEAGDLRKAVQELQYAIAQIQEMLNAQYIKLMPEPLAGWSAEEPQAQTAAMSMMGGGTQVSREYRNKDSGESVKIQVMADSPFIQAMSMMLANPMMTQSDPSTKLYRHKGHRGILKHRANSKQWEISLLIANRILVQVNGRGLTSKAALEAYLNTLDLAEVEKAFTL